MKKFWMIILALSYVIMVYIGFKVRDFQVNNYQNTNNDIGVEDRVNAENEKNISAGMTVTMLGGSNMEDKGNINSMGYFILTVNNELIFIDGGRDIDSELVKFYIDKYGNGKVDHWFITHPHSDHAGALLKLLAEENNLEIENIYYSLLDDEWYKENDTRGYETAHTMIERIGSPKIKNRVECKTGQNIKIDNTEVDIIRIANSEVVNSDNGNDASMCFKITATDVDKSILFLGDSYVYASKELMLVKDELKADAVQMSHHGQNGVSKEVYEAISPKVCFFNCPKYLYENDNGNGFNSGNWQSVEVRRWVDELEAVSYKAFNGDQIFEFTKNGIVKSEC